MMYWGISLVKVTDTQSIDLHGIFPLDQTTFHWVFQYLNLTYNGRETSLAK